MVPISRSENMRRIRSNDTGPEITVRKLLHELGFRFRLHRKNLPGRPDIILPKYKTAIFVNGCFWHGHGCRRGRLPKSNLDYWKPKIQKNKMRDAWNMDLLTGIGWNPMILWECEVQNRNMLETRLLTIRCSQQMESSGS